MKPKDECPKCHKNLQGQPIPQKYIDKGYYPKGTTHYSNAIGVEVRGVYDGVIAWKCPFCKGLWPREGMENLFHYATHNPPSEAVPAARES